MLAAAMTVPWWSVPSAVLAALGIWALITQGRGIAKSGLAGSGHSVWKGQTARSVAETAANAATAIGIALDELKAEYAHEKDLWRVERDGFKAEIDHLKADNDRLTKLITQSEWGKAISEQIEANHREVLQLIGGPKP